MFHEFNDEDMHAKSRSPSTVRIDVDLVSRKITAVWELLQVAKQMAFAPEQLSGNDELDVLSAAQMAIRGSGTG